MCGVFGIYGHPEASNLAYLGLHALQHRGQESAGIVSAQAGHHHAFRGMGYVADLFTAEVLAQLPGNVAIGHVRYSTAGVSHPKNAQPLAIEHARERTAIAHNGNLVNAESLRGELERQGAIFHSNSDTEVILHLHARSRAPSFEARLVEALRRVEGAYSLVLLDGERLIAVRDPHGFRPLVLGRLKDAYVVASETTALDLLEAEYVREIAPGEMLVIDEQGLHTTRPFAPKRAGRCVFEHVYFARPDSVVFGQSVYAVRKRLGQELAKVKPATADLVIAVPDSGVSAAIGYSQASGIPYDVGLIRSHYVGRTFIEPQQSIRHFGVKLKLSAVREVLQGKRVVVIDDSIVRGTTSRKIVKMLKSAGATEVHMRISSPPTKWPCYFGIDTPSRNELIAATHSEDEIARYITADSLGYLDLEGLGRAVGDAGSETYCNACFSGKYLTENFQPAERRALGEAAA
ncbi:MAG: amidophosphoribosyltransferase [Myxococcaceae bacterium]